MEKYSMINQSEIIVGMTFKVVIIKVNELIIYDDLRLLYTVDA